MLQGLTHSSTSWSDRSHALPLPSMRRNTLSGRPAALAKSTWLMPAKTLGRRDHASTHLNLAAHAQGHPSETLDSRHLHYTICLGPSPAHRTDLPIAYLRRAAIAHATSLMED